MKTVAIHQPQYLPYPGFFHKIRNCDVFIILDNVQFQKNGLQNRNRIKTSQGWQWLTVPVLQRSDQLILETRINSQIQWQRKHWNAIVTNYSRAPYFESHASSLQEVLNQEWISLSDLDVALIRWVMNALKLETTVVSASTLSAAGSRTDLLVNLCKATGADAYLSGPGGKLYMDLNAFELAGIEVVWQEYHPVPYTQLFPTTGFEKNLSIVDALFCCGPETVRLFEQQRAQDSEPMIEELPSGVEIPEEAM